MQVHSDYREIKAAGELVKRDLDSYEIAINYGQLGPTTGAWKEVVTVDSSGKIIDRHAFPISSSKLANNSVLLDENAVAVILREARKYEKDNAQKSIFLVDTQNNIIYKPVIEANLSIHSFYKSSANPRPAAHKDKPKLIKLHEIKTKPRPPQLHPRSVYTDISHHENKIELPHPVSFINGRELAQKIKKLYGAHDYASGLIKLITQTHNIHTNTPILYQSICIPANDSVDLGSHGAHHIATNPEFFLHEIDALYELQKKHGYNKIKISIPNVKSAHDLEKIKLLLWQRGITRSHRFQLIAGIETPGAIFTLDAILSTGVDGVLCDLKKMSQHILGLDTHLFDAQIHLRDQAILKTLDILVNSTERWNIPLILYISQHNLEVQKHIPHKQHIQVIYPEIHV